MMTFGQVAEMLAKSASRCRAELEVDLAAVGALAVPAAAEFIGHELPQWAPLAASTVAEKKRLGYTGQVSATDPLLREGTLRDSIGAEVEGLELVVGSTDKIAAYQFAGTAHIPPRDPIALAMLGALDHAADRLGERGIALTTPQGSAR
jgi:hypothetical protein